METRRREPDGSRHIVLSAGGASVTIDPDRGGRLTSWRVGDLELLGARSALPEEYGCYPMAPWPGRLRQNRFVFDGETHALAPTYAGWAIHGLVLGQPWRVVRSGAADVGLAAELDRAWPWPGTATLTWQLGGDSLTSELAISSPTATFPAELGWHPWFRRRLERGGDLVWRMDAAGMLERGEDHLPMGRRLDPSVACPPLDDAFEVPDGRTEIHWPGALHLRCESDATWVVVYDELPDLVCVEPQTAPPAALGDGSALVRPGSPRRASARWTWRADDVT